MNHKIDTEIERDESFGSLESAKAVIELIAPVGGQVVNVNDDLLDDVGIINSDPHDTGWLIVIEMSDLDEIDDLLDTRGYNDFILESEED